MGYKASYQPQTIDEARDFVSHAVRVQAVGSGSKTALARPRDGWDVLDITGLRGVLSYEPGEFTFTALAGTPVRDILEVLDQHHQYLPFDPLLVRRGATLGGTVAANTAGPGRYHYGGVRDFLIGVQLVNGDGHLVKGGGKVVKNAAGFDLPKLVVGSLGALGVLVALSFKVFPRPQAYVTLRAGYPTLEAALRAMAAAAAARLDPAALDLQPDADGYSLWARLGGVPKALPARQERLRALLGECQVIDDAEEEALLWQDVCELAWAPAGWTVVRVGLTAGRIPALEGWLAGHAAANGVAANRGIGNSGLADGSVTSSPPTIHAPVLRRYAAGGQLAWLALDGSLQPLDDWLRQQNLTGLVLLGETDTPRLGAPAGQAFYQRVKRALDPANHLAEI